jgi:hypothetical protein
MQIANCKTRIHHWTCYIYVNKTEFYRQLVERVNDSISLSRFCDLSLEDPVPDQSIVSPQCTTKCITCLGRPSQAVNSK